MDKTNGARLIDANRLKEESYKRLGLESIKFITLIDEQPTAAVLNIRYEDKEKSDNVQP